MNHKSPIRPEIISLEPSGISKIAAGSLYKEDVIPLWFGESDLVTADFIRDAAIQALNDGETFYSVSRGHPALRQALGTYHQQIYGIDLDPGRIHVPGSTMLAVMVATQCLAAQGDEVILLSPCWPNIRHVLNIQGVMPVDVRLKWSTDGWKLDPAELEKTITSKTKAIYINSPSNPTGWVADHNDIKTVMEIARRHGLGVISDEVYHRNVYDQARVAPSFLEHADENEPVFVLNGFSKAWAMTGWRLGWFIGPSNLYHALAVLCESNNTGATVFAQKGGVAALEKGEPFLQHFIQQCESNRQLLMDILGEHPRVSLTPPEGAFYAFARIEGIEGDSLAFAQSVLEECNVGISPGYTFGPGNDDFVRICFAISADRLKDALLRIKKHLG